MGNNILRNPTLTGFSKPPIEFFDKAGVKGYIEHPDHWEYIWTPMHDDDPNRIPQSLHRDNAGFVMSAGWRVWEAGYVQRGIQVRAGQRYLAKAIVQAHIGWEGGQPEGWNTHIQWRFWIQSGESHVEAQWASTQHRAPGNEDEHLFVFEPTSDMTIDLYMKARSVWSNNACDFQIKSITLEEVPQDYGQPAYLHQPGAAQPAPTNLAPAGTAPASTTTPTPAASSGAVTLVMSQDDIEVIVRGLRAMNQVTPNAEVIAGLTRLADVLERLMG